MSELVPEETAYQAGEDHSLVVASQEKALCARSTWTVRDDPVGILALPSEMIDLRIYGECGRRTQLPDGLVSLRVIESTIISVGKLPTSLRYLYLEDCPNLRLEVVDAAYPKLRTIAIMDCPEIVFLPVAPALEELYLDEPRPLVTRLVSDLTQYQRVTREQFRHD